MRTAKLKSHSRQGRIESLAHRAELCRSLNRPLRGLDVVVMERFLAGRGKQAGIERAADNDRYATAVTFVEE